MKIDFLSLLKEEKTLENMMMMYEKDFTFIFHHCKKKIKFNRFLADLISPKVNEMHHLDETITTFEIIDCFSTYNPETQQYQYQNQNQDQHQNSKPNHCQCHNIYFHFLKLFDFFKVKKETKNISPNESKENEEKEEKTLETLEEREYQQILEVLYLLGNEKSVFKLLSQRKIKINLSNLKETYHRIRNQSHKNHSIFQICSMKEIIDFCILNFEKKEVQEMIFQFLKVEEIEEIEEIFSSNNFQIKDEDSFFEIIINLIEERGEDLYSLLSFVNFVNLSNEKRTQYFDFLDPMKIEMKHWNYFITQIKTYFRNSLRLKYFIQPSTNHEFEGIFNRLNQECFGNCATKKLIDITCSSINYTSPEFLFDYSTLSIEDWWTLKNENNGYIQIDFKDKRINLSHYSLHTPVCSEKISHTPKTWTIEGSNDLNRWNILDSRSNDPYTKNYNSFHCYECSNKDIKFYRYIRFYLRGRDHGGWYYSELSGIEFFGKLISC